ncbi:MAG: hypothetical protein KF775_04815 [Cyclobacteriaceae bacterium]|nr:hypothetical protein [Cyclobacteriaceae bacterium]
MRLVAFTWLWMALSASAQISDFKDADFKKADKVARLYQHHSLYDLKALADKLTSGLQNDEEKFRAIFTWICLNIKNDYELFKLSIHERQVRTDKAELDTWHKEFSKVIFRRLLEEHTTICTGYAYLVRELALVAGIDCIMIDGYSLTPTSQPNKELPNHSWNGVKLNNKWYLCDATWASGSIEAVTHKFKPRYDDRFFLMEPNVFVRSHFPLDTAWMLMAQKPDWEKFVGKK